MTAILAPGHGVMIASNVALLPGTVGGGSVHMGAAVTWASTSVLDAAGERLAQIGRVVWADRGTHTISSSGGKIYFSLNTPITWANGSTALDVGVQDLTAASVDPDGTFDVKATLVPGVESLSASALNLATMETGSKSIANGAIVAVVFHMTARGGSDSVVMNRLSFGGWGGVMAPYGRFHNGTAWSHDHGQPQILFQADDGTWGWFAGCPLFGPTWTTVTYNSGTAGADEYGARVKLPWPISIEAITVPISVPVAADFELCLYSTPTGTPSLVVAVSIDAAQENSAFGSGDYYYTVHLGGERALEANVEYGWTVRPTTANSLTMDYNVYGSGNNDLMRSLLCGQESYLIKRLDNSGAFSTQNSDHVPYILHVSRFHDRLGARARSLVGVM